MSKSPERSQWRERVLFLLSIPLVCYLLQVGQHLWQDDESPDQALAMLLFEGKEIQHQKTEEVLLTMLTDLDEKDFFRLRPKLLHRLLDQVMQSKVDGSNRYSDRQLFKLVELFITHPDIVDYFVEQNEPITPGFYQKLKIFAEMGLDSGKAQVAIENDIRFRFISPTSVVPSDLGDSTITSPAEVRSFFSDDESQVDVGFVTIERSERKLIPLDFPEVSSIQEILLENNIDLKLSENVWLERRTITTISTEGTGYYNQHTSYTIIDSTNSRLGRIKVFVVTIPMGGPNQEELTRYDAEISYGEGQFFNPSESVLEQIFTEAELAWQRN